MLAYLLSLTGRSVKSASMMVNKYVQENRDESVEFIIYSNHRSHIN